MSWISKEQPTPFDGQPIDGLFFLDGDALALYLLLRAQARGKDITGRTIGTEGYKMPMIAFPSGKECELWDGTNSPVVHIFGEMDLALNATREQGFEQANDIAEQCGYIAKRVEEHVIEVWGHDTDEHFRILYDNHNARIADIVRVKADPNERATFPQMELLTADIRAKLPPLYTNEKLGLNALAQVKFFTPDAQWTWYASEFDGEDRFFGLVVSFEIELGYFHLSELREVRGGMNLPIERDRFFEPTTLRELKAYHQKQRGE